MLNLIAYLYVELFNIFVYGSCICIYFMNVLGNWSIEYGWICICIIGSSADKLHHPRSVA